MNITIQEQDNQVVIMFDGRLDTASTIEARQSVSPVFDCQNKEIILDCTNMTFVSSSGLRLLLDILKFTKPNGCNVFVKNLSEDIREVFNVTGFINFFQYL
ncbi:MAG: STAS domain-containing protein [Prevotella sp.]|jgi:anti-sigma B factor antagonist|nr:STAS domain-containing protein [Prevotella sp.]